MSFLSRTRSSKLSWIQACLPFLLGLIVSCIEASTTDSTKQESNVLQEPLILVHYMPWYQAPPIREDWGWHWTMNAFDPEDTDPERRRLASKFTPLIGPYDSSDEAVLEYHLLLMKLAGIDGVIIDWYGLSDYRDYGDIHQSSKRLVEAIERFGMKFAVCYEDQTVSALVEAGRLEDSKKVDYAAEEIRWLAENWFAKPNYARIEGKPVLLSFGLDGLSNREWTECLTKMDTDIAYFSEHHKRTAAVGAFDWPIPSEGVDRIHLFDAESRNWRHAIPVAFPRFVDVYKEAGVGPGWGYIPDEEGATFRRTLENALGSKSLIVQLVTWNDWGEGTMLEPSVEFGYRDLELIQSLSGRGVGEARDFELPYELLRMRRDRADTKENERLDRIADWISDGEVEKARRAIEDLKMPSS